MIALSEVEVGDIIKFKYTGFLKPCGATGKIVYIAPSGKSMNIAVSAGHVWAVKAENLTIESIEEKASGSSK